MAAFNFPDPTIQQTVTNPITGSTYQWKEPPGKWVITTKVRSVSDIIYEGDNPPIPRGDYKLWYSTDTLELYFWYEDVNGNGAWVPTAAPITMLEDLDNSVFELRQDLTAVNVAVRENENQIGRTIYFSDTAPTIYDDTVYDGVAYPNELNYKFWYDTERLELLILFRDADGDDSYTPVSIPLESLPEPGVSTETFTYTTGRLQTAIEENYLHNLNQDAALDDRVKKTGGDEMQGPFKVLPNPDIPSSRDARRIETYGVFSGSESTALRLGTSRDRIYVGHDDTSFNGLVKIDRIAEKNANNSVKFENDIKMGFHQIKNLGDATDDKDAVTYGQVKQELIDALTGSSAVLEHSPYVANMQGTKSGVNSNTPGPNEVAGFYTSSTSDGSRNEYPGNFNSLLKCGAQIVSVQEGANNYAALPDGHDERWTGTVSVLDKNSGGLLYKNTIVKVNRTGEYIYIWVREPGSERGNKPMFGYGTISNWTNINVLVEGYRLK